MFSKKPADNTPSIPSAPVASKGRNNMGGGNSTFSMIGGDVTIVGNITASADLHIDGRVEGDITCASLVQGETSEVEGAIEAETARLSGRVDGSISAKELVILKSARINGDVHYDALTIEQGAQVEGRFAHRTKGAAAATPSGMKATTKDSDEPALSLAN